MHKGIGLILKGGKGVMFLWLCLLACVVQGADFEHIRLASDPALSPDGSRLAFAWRGDIWIVPTEGGVARQLTEHPAGDRQPAFSPDGSQIAFVSDRNTGSQVYVMPVEGGAPEQLTFHTAGYTLEQWYPSGDALLVNAGRDHIWRDSQRFFKIDRSERKAEELLFDAYGQDGALSPDGGGFTTDHLLTMLCQPSHAITVPRGGGPGYPEDRRVYATWSKPIVVLCNQNSFSNAEIFSHAIKTLKRGKLVGVPTAGGVISTGSTQVMDVGYLRLPFRGWYVLGTGEDMELNGTVPDYVLWNEPGEMPSGEDAQLDKAVEVLLEDVKVWESRPKPKLRKATERAR